MGASSSGVFNTSTLAHRDAAGGVHPITPELLEGQGEHSYPADQFGSHRPGPLIALLLLLANFVAKHAANCQEVRHCTIGTLASRRS
jgi:hypothetical protein